MDNSSVWEEVACNRCGCEPARLVDLKMPTKYKEKGKWRFVECPNCRLRFYSPRLEQTEQWLDHCMRNEGSKVQVEKILKLGTALPIPEGGARRRIEYNRGIYGRYLEKASGLLGRTPRKIYEVGCNIGRLLDVAAKLFDGVFVSGCDPNPHAVKICEEEFGITVEESLFQCVKDAEKDFDIIVGWNFIEHSSTPVDDIKKAHSMLAKGGILFLRTFHEEGNADDYQTSPIAHQHHFFKDVLCGILLENGFETILEVTGRDFFVFGRKI